MLYNGRNLFSTITEGFIGTKTGRTYKEALTLCVRRTANINIKIHKFIPDVNDGDEDYI
jgi:hypothetical protein